jgi:hypothetical protein
VNKKASVQGHVYRGIFCWATAFKAKLLRSTCVWYGLLPLPGLHPIGQIIDAFAYPFGRLAKSFPDFFEASSGARVSIWSSERGKKYIFNDEDKGAALKTNSFQ